MLFRSPLPGLQTDSTPLVVLCLAKLLEPAEASRAQLAGLALTRTGNVAVVLGIATFGLAIACSGNVAGLATLDMH